MGDLDPSRTISELRELQELTGDANGAQRVAWTDTWQRARDWFEQKLAELGLPVETDEAGNQWATLAGESPEALLIGGHLDSVVNGGWLDGCLNVLAGLEVLRGIVSEGRPSRSVRLVSWADEEGSRFGRSLLGSSAAAGTLDPAAVKELRDQQGTGLPEAIEAFGLQLDRMGESRRRLEGARAYLELHIEQGPVLERLGLPLGVVLGTCGVERHSIRFTGQAAHAGSTPMDMRRDAFAAAARLALEVRESARRSGGVATVGRVVTTPGIVTAVAGVCEITLDQRHLEAEPLARMLSEARAAADLIAGEEGVRIDWEEIFRIDPIPFHPQLIELCEQAVVEVAGRSHRLPSGPLHDASEMARSGIPTAMLFVQSLNGLSHTKEEDTSRKHLELSVRALNAAVRKTLAWLDS